MSRFIDDKQVAANAAQAEKNEDLLTRWLVRNPDVPDTIATRKAFHDYFGDDWCLELEIDDFSFAVSQMETVVTRQRVPSEAEKRQKLVDDICNLLRSPSGDGFGGRYSDVALQNERKRLHTFQTDVLISRRDEILQKQRLQKMSVPEIRREQAANKPTPSRWYPHEDLPANTTAEDVKKALRSWDARSWVRRFGTRQLNAKLFGDI